MAKLLAPGVVSTPAAATSSRRLLAFVWLRQTHDRPIPDLHHAGRRRHPHAAPHAHASPLTTAVRVSPLTIALTSDASTWARLMFGLGGLGFAVFSVGMKA